MRRGTGMSLTQRQIERINFDLMVFLKEHASKEEMTKHITHAFSSEMDQQMLLDHVNNMLENDGEKVVDFFKHTGK